MVETAVSDTADMKVVEDAADLKTVEEEIPADLEKAVEADSAADAEKAVTMRGAEATEQNRTNSMAVQMFTLLQNGTEARDCIRKSLQIKLNVFNF